MEILTREVAGRCLANAGSKLELIRTYRDLVAERRGVQLGPLAARDEVGDRSVGELVDLLFGETSVHIAGGTDANGLVEVLVRDSGEIVCYAVPAHVPALLAALG